MFNDDFSFCRNFNGLNIAVTGCTGNIGSIVVDSLLKNSQPNKVALFCRDDQNLPTQVQQMIRVPATSPDKRVYSYEVDFIDAPKIANKCHQMMRNLDGRIDVILFCHGLINFMGGIDGNLPEWDLI